jgi:site-specific DNA recombinase
MQAVIYARVSTEEQLGGYSIEAQLDACRKVCRDRGWTIECEYVEPGESAKNFERREKWQELMHTARARRFDVLVCHKIDRFSRATILDSLSALDELRSHKISFVSASEPIDFTTSHGELTLVLFLWFARHYLINLSAEITKGRRKRAESGRSNANHPPFGYLRNEDGEDLPDPKTRNLAAAMFNRYITGVYGDGSIARWLNAQGARTLAGNLFTASAVRELLINPFYAGWVRYRGMRETLTSKRTRRRETRLIRGTHEPLISQAVFDKAQALRKTRNWREGRGATTMRPYLLRDLAHCAHCGRRMKCSCSEASKLRYSCVAGEKMADCPASGITVREELLLPQIECMIATLQLPEAIINRAAELLDSDDGKDRSQQRRAEIIGEMKRLDYLFQKGRKPPADYERELGRLEAELQLLEPAPVVPVEQGARVLEDLLDAWHATCDSEARQEILKALLQGVRIDALQKRVVEWVPQVDFAPLFEVARCRF